MLVTVLGFKSDFEFVRIPNYDLAFQIKRETLTGKWS